MKTKFLMASAAVLVTAFSSLASAQTAPAERKARVEKLDINGDGLISRDEAAKAPRLGKQFDAIDSNKDGQLSRDELAAFRKSHGRPHGKGEPSGQSPQPGA